MEIDNVTRDELLDDLINLLDIKTKPCRADGWFTIRDIADNTGESVESIRNHANKMIGLEKIEKVIYSGEAFYRILDEDA